MRKIENIRIKILLVIILASTLPNVCKSQKPSLNLLNRLTFGIYQFETTGFELGLNHNFVKSGGSKSYYTFKYEPKYSLNYQCSFGIYPFLTDKLYSISFSSWFAPILKIPFTIEFSLPVFTTFKKNTIALNPKIGYLFLTKKKLFISTNREDLKSFFAIKLSYGYNFELMDDLMMPTHQISLSLTRLGHKINFKPEKILK